MLWEKFKSSLPSKLLSSDQPTSGNGAFDFLQPATRRVSALHPASGAWLLACQAYQQQVNLNPRPVNGSYFASFGMLHLTVAEIMLERRDEIYWQDGQRVVQITGVSGLLAVFCPQRKIVQVHKASVTKEQIGLPQQLAVRIMPAAAQLLEAAAAESFQTIPLAALMWHYGQNALGALDHLPDLHQRILQIRKFPKLEPTSLHLRQLQLIHAISHGNYHFESLLPELSDESRAYICPDLASLYLSGALSLKPA